MTQQLTCDELESRKQIAKRLSCHPKTIARAEARGEINAIRLNSKMIRYRKADVDAWIARSQSTRSGR